MDTREDACMHDIHNQQGIVQGVADAAKAEFVTLQGKVEQEIMSQKSQVQVKVSQIEDAFSKANHQLQAVQGRSTSQGENSHERKKRVYEKDCQSLKRVP